MATSSNPEMKLKLLFDKKNQKVVFAEAGKDFVDFLFSLMSLPLATVIALLSKNNMVGSIGNLYESIESLNTTYLQPNQNKDSILKPQVANLGTDFKNPLLVSNNSNTSRKVVYVCCNFSSSSYNYPSHGYLNHRYVADEPNSRCPGCNKGMSTEVPYVNNNNNAASVTTSKEVAASSEGGFVKGVVTYMVMDNLEVKPMSTISGITLLTKFNIRDLASLEEKEVDIGFNLGLKLLKESLQSNNVLTSVFFPNRARPGPN